MSYIATPSKLGIKYQISDKDFENYEYGCQFATILTRTVSFLDQTEIKILLKNSIDSIKQYKTNYAKKRNWQIIKAVLNELGLQIDNDDIELIKAGSRETLEQLLDSITEYEQTMFTKSESESTPKPKENPKRYKSGELIIEAINGAIQLETTKTSLEFLLVTFCKHFNLHPKQAAGLLTQSGKYLAFICSKGFKGKHEVIGVWLADMFKHSDHLIDLILNESQEGSLNLILTSLSHCFKSKSLENVVKLAKNLVKLVEDLQKLNPSSEFNEKLWLWFTSSGIEKCLACLKRFGAYIKKEIVSVFSVFSKHNYHELFTVCFPEQIPEIIQYLAFIHELLSSFLSGPSKDLVVSQGVMDFVIDLALEQAENLLIQPDERMTAINIICEIWVETQVIENSENFSNRVIKTFEKISRERSILLKISCLGRFFALLERFAYSKSSYAPVLYKIITFALVENYAETETKEFIMSNFLYLFDQIEVPLKILLEPLTKHLTISSVEDFNLLDFHFFSRIGEHPQLNTKLGLMFVDSLAKLFIEHEYFAELIGQIMLKIIEKFSNESVFHEYLIKFLKVYLKILEKSAGKEAKAKGIKWVVQNCLALKIDRVNEAMEVVICQALVANSVPKLGSWLMSILQICGDTMEIIQKYKKLINFEESEKTQKKAQKIETSVKEETQETVENLNQQNMRKSLRKQVETRVVEEPQQVSLKPKVFKSIEPFFGEDLEFIRIAMSSRKYIFLEIFKMFSSKRKLQKVETFDQLNHSVNTIADSDIYKILKRALDSSLMINQSHFVEFSKEFCQLQSRVKSFYEFQDFQYFLAYISCQIYTKSPQDYSLYPPIYSFLSLIKALEKGFPSKKQSPQYILPNQDPPQGYKKVKTKDIEIQHKVPPCLNCPSSYEISLNILDDLLFTSFSFHILEPQIAVVDLYKLQQDFINIQSKSISVSIHTTSPKKIVNKFEENKLKEKIAKIKESKIREQKRNLRVQLVKSIVMKTGTISQRKIEEKKKLEIDEEKKLVLIKKLEEKIERDRKLRIEEITKWKNQKEEELRIKNEMEKEKLNKERELRIKRREEFVENEKVRLRKLSLTIAENKKTIPKIEAEKELIEKKLREKKMEKHKMILEIARKNREQVDSEEKAIIEEFNSEDIQNVFKLYDKSMQLIFTHFCNSKHLPNNQEIVLKTYMVFADFYKFAKQFKIIPEIASKDECKKMFNLVMKNNENSAIFFDGFKFLCFKISKSAKVEGKSSEEVFKDLIDRLEIQKDINVMRNVLRKQETLKVQKGST